MCMIYVCIGVIGMYTWYSKILPKIELTTISQIDKRQYINKTDCRHKYWNEGINHIDRLTRCQTSRLEGVIDVEFTTKYLINYGTFHSKYKTNLQINNIWQMRLLFLSTCVKRTPEIQPTNLLFYFEKRNIASDYLQWEPRVIGNYRFPCFLEIKFYWYFE